MLEGARRRLREQVEGGARPKDIEATVQEAAPWLSEEQRSSLWLYAWHCTGNGDGAPRAQVSVSYPRAPR